MTFGNVWRTSDASFWDGMWSKHKDSAMTRRMLGLAADAGSVCEVGCGYGHFLQALLQTGWRGRFAGFEMSGPGTERTAARCRSAGIDHEVLDGNFSLWAARDFRSVRDVVRVASCDVAMCRGVVQHQAHWMPMTLAMLRLAPVAVVGIGYISDTEYHEGPRRVQGHYDVRISIALLEQEAKSSGLRVRVERFVNDVRKCKEALAIFEWET